MVAAQHQYTYSVRRGPAVCWLQPHARVSNSINTGGPLIGRGIIDRIDVQGLVTDLRAQRIDELLSRRANTGGVTGATGKHHLHVRTRLRRRRRNRWTRQRVRRLSWSWFLR